MKMIVENLTHKNLGVGFYLKIEIRMKLDPSRVLFKLMSRPLLHSMHMPHCYACLTFITINLSYL